MERPWDFPGAEDGQKGAAEVSLPRGLVVPLFYLPGGSRSSSLRARLSGAKMEGGGEAATFGDWGWMEDLMSWGIMASWNVWRGTGA